MLKELGSVSPNVQGQEVFVVVAHHQLGKNVAFIHLSLKSIPFTSQNRIHVVIIVKSECFAPRKLNLNFKEV